LYKHLPIWYYVKLSALHESSKKLHHPNLADEQFFPNMPQDGHFKQTKQEAFDSKLKIKKTKS